MNKCFVLMPFDDDFKDVYDLGIKSACIGRKLSCARVDEQVFSQSILEQIYSQIKNADILIAEMTTGNPNVFYEVGYAHALHKNVILLVKDSKEIPFDLKHFPHIIYNSISFLKKELDKKLAYFIANPVLPNYNWNDLTRGFVENPETISKLEHGKILKYKYSANRTFYRLIPEPYDPVLDCFYNNFDGKRLTGIVAQKINV